jgi:NAD(P)-dependent dehydrogenase (short-subunit alcohol dehydrogenase family)
VDTARPSSGCPGQAWVSPSGAGIGLSNTGDTHTETPRQVLTGARVTGTVTRTVVVAGVGPGLGSSAAREFAAQGDEVALLARSAEYLEETAADISSTEDGTALAVPTDVAESDAVEAAFETIHERFGPVDALVNNVSSTETTGGGILDATETALEGAWEVRVAGQFRCARAAAKDIAAGEGARYYSLPRSRLSCPARVSPTARRATRSGVWPGRWRPTWASTGYRPSTPLSTAGSQSPHCASGTPTTTGGWTLTRLLSPTADSSTTPRPSTPAR